MNHELGYNQSSRATQHYFDVYKDRIYLAATNGKRQRYCNRLIDDALAICGSPNYELSKTNYGQEALDFLNLFVR